MMGRHLQLIATQNGRTDHRMPAFCASATLILLLTAPAAPAGEMRTWTSSNGAYRIEAELVDVTASGLVRLKSKDGTFKEVPLSRLSRADQDFVRTQGTKAKEAGLAGALSTPPKSPNEVEAEALACRTAKEAVLVYRFYLALPNLTAEQRAVATAKLKDWESKVADDQVRLGGQWMPKAEAEKLRQQADAKIDQAMEYLRLSNGELARKNLDEASKLDPESIRADFLMGIVYGLHADNYRKSQQHFEKCLLREPDNVSVQNNLAVTLVFQKKYREASRLWKSAATSAPKMRAVSQNIGSLITMAGNGRAKVPDKTLDELSAIYEELTTTNGHPRPTEIGFVFTPPYGVNWGKGESEKPGGKSESVVVSSGSGFVVHPHIILTNNHVVKGATGLLVLDPKNPQADPLPAELIALSENPDLALIRCQKLDAPAVRLAEKLPPRGTDIMILGYPLGPSFGTTLKSTRGAMVAMPDRSLENMFLYDAITNPGNSGGPLCDMCGRVAGVVRAVTGSVGGTYGAGISITDAMPFIRKHVPELAATTSDAKEVDWPTVDAMVSPSTVLIMTKEDLRTDAGVSEFKKK
jgi:S1-C subfamily serine protease